MTQLAGPSTSPLHPRAENSRGKAPAGREIIPLRATRAGPSTVSVADTPIPSTEVEDDDLPNGDYTTSRPGHRSTPSISISPIPTPSATPGSNDAESSSPRPRNHTVGSIGPALEALQLNTLAAMDLSAMSSEIEGIITTRRSQTAELVPEPDSTSAARARAQRRRSSSRVNEGRHEVEDEEPPKDPFNEPAFQKAFKTATSAMSTIKEILESGTLHQDPDTMMTRLHSDAVRLSNFICPSTRVVGFVGDSGVGKSSLLNSLLDYKGLARTSNSGAACTCVATEYHYHNSSTFKVHVVLFEEKELHDQLSGLLQAYRHYHLNQDTMDREDQKDFEARAKVAEDTFKAMFRQRLGNSLRFILEDSERSVLQKLTEWATDTVLGPASDDYVCNTLEECSSLISNLTSEVSSNTELPDWPYIRKIMVYSNAYILSRGLVLVDLPGLRDLNAARQNVTERFILECDEIFAVCNIGRATTDVGVKSVIELARSARLTDVGIICTRSDDIKAEEAIRDWQGTVALRIQDLRDEVADRSGELAKNEEELRPFDNNNDLDDEDEEYVRDLNRNGRLLRRQLEDSNFSLKSYLVTTRNQRIIKRLKELYKETFPEELNVFCVSNEDYWKNRDEFKSKSVRFLHLSGIISIRKHCAAMVANSQLRIATRYIQQDIPAFLGDLDLWVRSGSGTATAEQKTNVRETLDVVERRLKQDLLGRTSKVKTIARSLNQTFDQHIYRNRQIGEWSSVANDAVSVWSRWSHPTYSAFCRQYGSHSTGASGGFHDWNEEAIEGMVQSLSSSFETLHTTFYTQQDGVMDLVSGAIDWSMDKIDNDLGETSDSAETLLEALQSRNYIIIASIEDQFAQQRLNLLTLRTDALSGIRTSIVGKAMEQSYIACMEEGGRGSDQRRKAIIRNALGSRQFFENHMTEFRERFKKLVEELELEIKMTVEINLEQIATTMDIVRSDNVALESERDQEFRSLVEDGVREAKETMRELQTVLEHH